MTLGEIYSLVNYILNKEQNGEAISPTQFQLLLATTNIEYFTKKYGLPEQWQPGQALPIEAWEKTQKISDDLRLSKGWVEPMLINTTTGRASLPTDYVHASAIRRTYLPTQNAEPKTTEIDLLNDSQFNSRLTDTITFPTIKHPIATLIGNEIQFEPKNLQRCIFSYLRLPVKPVFDYDIVSTQVNYLAPGEQHANSTVQPVNTPSLSVELEWPEVNHISFVSLLIGYCGINMRETQLIQYSESKKQRGI